MLDDVDYVEMSINALTQETSMVRINTAGGLMFREPFVLPSMHERYTAFQSTLDDHEPITEDAILDFGLLLYQSLFPGMIREGFQIAQAEAIERGKLLHIHLDIEQADWIRAMLPWEFAMNAQGRPLAVAHPFSRVPPRRALLPALGRGSAAKLKVAISSALPSELAHIVPLDLTTEIANIRQALDVWAQARPIEIVEVPHLTTSKLHHLLEEEQPHILHHIGHGLSNNTMGMLVLETDTGTQQNLSAQQLSTLLDGSTVDLLMLTLGLHGGALAPLFQGIAPHVISGTPAAVVGIPAAFSEQTGRLFMRAFYRALASGLPIDRSVAAGRKALFAHDIRNLDWGRVMLYMRPTDALPLPFMGV